MTNREEIVPVRASIKWKNVTVNLSALQPWADNPRTMTKRQAQRLLRSWRELGQFQTITIGSQGEIYDGHQRLNALLSVYGATYEVEARQADRELTDEERRDLTLAANIPAGAWDWSALTGWDASQLQEWGMDVEQLRNWRSDLFNLSLLLEVEPDFSPAGMDEQGRLDQRTPVTCPECGAIFSPK